MVRGGENPKDYRSEAERIGARPDEPAFETEYHRGAREAKRVETKRAARFESAETNTTRLGSAQSDQIIKQRVIDVLNMESSTDSSDVTVDVEDGVVLLEGSVDTINTKYRASELVKRLAGVTEVDNRLTIRVGEALDEFTRGVDTIRARLGTTTRAK
jgi:hypothetical protein